MSIKRFSKANFYKFRTEDERRYKRNGSFVKMRNRHGGRWSRTKVSDTHTEKNNVSIVKTTYPETNE